MIGNEAARGTEFQAFGGSKPNHVTLAIYTINWRTYGLHQDFLKWIKFSPNNSSHVNSTLESIGAIRNHVFSVANGSRFNRTLQSVS
jgi:hypothetical protein